MEWEEYDADVVIVGSGVAGAMIGARLASAGLSVIILEAGPYNDRADSVERYHSGLYPYANTEWAPQPAGVDVNSYYVQDGPTDFTSDYERRVGGTTWHWLGNSPRFLPSDFEMQTRFGVGVDWPISYDDLEPWYLDAEYELGIAGDSDNDGGSPRSGPYPMPPLPLASGDYLFKEAAESLGYEVIATPQARNSIEGYQGRSICCGNATCVPICPVQAKYDAMVHVDLAIEAGAQLIENAVVFHLDVDEDGDVSAVHYKSPDNEEHTVSGRVVVVAANGIETPKLLLMSQGEYSPDGVANSSDLVGRNLADHPLRVTTALLPTPYAGGRGPLQLSGIDSIREGDFRSERAAFRYEISHSAGNPLDLARDLIAEGVTGRELFERIQNTAPYQVSVTVLSEQLPDPENRVVPDEDHVDALGIPRPRITYSIDDYTMRGLEAGIQFNHEIFDVMGATDRFDSPVPFGAGHLMGTYQMGDDPATSVTDTDGRTHDHANLFLAGSGLFPTSASANPTLTLAALALITADAIGRDFGVQIPSTPAETAPGATPMATPAAD